MKIDLSQKVKDHAGQDISFHDGEKASETNLGQLIELAITTNKYKDQDLHFCTKLDAYNILHKMSQKPTEGDSTIEFSDKELAQINYLVDSSFTNPAVAIPIQKLLQ